MMKELYYFKIKQITLPKYAGSTNKRAQKYMKKFKIRSVALSGGLHKNHIVMYMK